MKKTLENTEEVTNESIDSGPGEIPNINNPVPKTESIRAGKFAWISKAKTYVATHKKFKIGLIAGGVLLVLFFVLPATRYPILGVIIKKDVTVKVTDKVTNLPISEASVEISGSTQTTNNEGLVTFKNVSVGKTKVFIIKKYYEPTTENGFVGLSPKAIESKIAANGQPIKFQTINKIDKKPVENTTISSGDSKVTTDKDGKAVLVVPVGQDEIEVKTQKEGFADSTAKYKVSEIIKSDNTIEITPSGKIFFLSKQSGKIDVVSTNLDGTDRKIVLPGTGFESDNDTILLASRDWKFLALKANRDDNNSSNAIYVINTSDGTLHNVDEGNAEFTLNGWSGNHLVYKVSRNDVPNRQAGKESLKSFEANSKKLTTLDSTNLTKMPPGVYSGMYHVDGLSLSDTFSFVSITESAVTYMRAPLENFSCEHLKNGIYSINTDGTQKKTVFESLLKDTYLSSWSAYTYKPGEIYYQATSPACTETQSPIKSYEYSSGGGIKEISENDFNQSRNSYKSFVVSPDGKETFWADSRDGKNVFFIGDLSLENEKEVARLEEFNVYGWYNNYLLVSKKGSELFVMSRDAASPVKITDYHKPSYDYRGYGYGYGGL